MELTRQLLNPKFLAPKTSFHFRCFFAQPARKIHLPSAALPGKCGADVLKAYTKSADVFFAAFFARCLYLRPEFRHGGNQRGKGEGQQGGGSPGEPAEGPTIADLQRCWGFHKQSYKRRI